MLIEQKEQSSMPLHQWSDIQVLRGRYGAYIHTPEGNYQLPKGTDAEALTEAEVRAIIAKSAPIKPGKRTFYRKK
jgi:topoisomerase IA-like protein